MIIIICISYIIMEIPAIKLGKGVKMITANTTKKSGVGNFTYMNGYNFIQRL